MLDIIVEMSSVSFYLKNKNKKKQSNIFNYYVNNATKDIITI